MSKKVRPGPLGSILVEVDKGSLRKAGRLHVYRRNGEVIAEVVPGQNHSEAWAAVTSA